MSVIVGRLKDMSLVYDDEGTPHVDAGANRRLRHALPSCLPEAENDYIKKTVFFNKVIGQSVRVLTTDEDVTAGRIYWAQREGRRGLSRFVENREPVGTQQLTFIIKRMPDGLWWCRSAYFGMTLPEPFSTKGKKKHRSKAFWSNHAFVAGSVPIVADTMTRECPW